MTYIEGLKKDIDTLEKEHEEARQALLQVYQKLTAAKFAYQRVCSHENRKEVKKSYEGGYDYKAEYHTDTYCEDCGAFLGRQIEYGGFG